MQILVDRSRCTGMGLCEMTAPQIFEVGEDGQADVIAEATPETLPLIDEAVINCPTSALALQR